MSDRLLNTDETVRLLHISRQTLYSWMGKRILNPVDMYPAQLERRPKLMFRESEVKRLAPTEPIEDEIVDDPPQSLLAATV